MRLKTIKIVSALVVFLAASALLYYVLRPPEAAEPFRLALAGPISGPDSLIGVSMKRGAQLFVDRVNDNGGVNGKNLVLAVYDDANSAAEARRKAREIVDDGRAIAVIGHFSSRSSVAAGEIYKSHGIPAISPGSTHMSVTRNNRWYFRTVHTDSIQAHFLVYSIKEALEQDTFSIIHTPGAFLDLDTMLEQSAARTGLTLSYKWEVARGINASDERLQRIIRTIRRSRNAGALLLLTHSSDGITLVKAMRDARIENPLLGPDNFAQEAFLQGITSLPEEQQTPGYYSDDMFVSAPLLFEAANQEAQYFRDRYMQEHGEEPHWLAAYTYDAAKFIAEGLKRMAAREKQETGFDWSYYQEKLFGKADTLRLRQTQEALRVDRAQLRDELASIGESGFEGVTGQ